MCEFGRLKYFEISDTYLVWFDFSINKEEITSVGLHDIEQNFVKHLDVDHDGILDMKELIKWVEPDGFQGVGYTVLFNLMGAMCHKNHCRTKI